MSNETKVGEHTPGPLAVRVRPGGRRAIEDAHGNVLANVLGYDVGANARLMAAAPDLLAALEAYVAGDYLAQGSTASAQRHNARRDAARAAIRAARGEGP